MPAIFVVPCIDAHFIDAEYGMPGTLQNVPTEFIIRLNWQTQRLVLAGQPVAVEFRIGQGQDGDNALTTPHPYLGNFAEVVGDVNSFLPITPVDIPMLDEALEKFDLLLVGRTPEFAAKATSCEMRVRGFSGQLSKVSLEEDRVIITLSLDAIDALEMEVMGMPSGQPEIQDPKGRLQMVATSG